MTAVLTPPEVAALFRRSPAWFRGARASLEAAGFPPPLPATGGRRWSRAAVEAWLNGEHTNQPPITPAVLAERGRAVAAGMGRRR